MDQEHINSVNWTEIEQRYPQVNLYVHKDNTAECPHCHGQGQLLIIDDRYSGFDTDRPNHVHGSPNKPADGSNG
jgi:hypothetical protein